MSIEHLSHEVPLPGFAYLGEALDHPLKNLQFVHRGAEVQDAVFKLVHLLELHTLRMAQHLQCNCIQVVADCNLQRSAFRRLKIYISSMLDQKARTVLVLSKCTQMKCLEPVRRNVIDIEFGLDEFFESRNVVEVRSPVQCWQVFAILIFRADLLPKLCQQKLQEFRL